MLFSGSETNISASSTDSSIAIGQMGNGNTVQNFSLHIHNPEPSSPQLSLSSNELKIYDAINKQISTFYKNKT